MSEHRLSEVVRETQATHQCTKGEYEGYCIVGPGWLDSLATQIEALEDERNRLADIEADFGAVIARGDAMFAAFHAHFQAESDAKYEAEFGVKGPHLAGILRTPQGLNSPDRAYVYWRHRLSDKYPDLPDAGRALGQRS